MLTHMGERGEGSMGCEGDASHSCLALSGERIISGKPLEHAIGVASSEASPWNPRSARRPLPAGTDIRTAERADMVENAYRDVNVASAGELTLPCERMDPGAPCS